MPQMCPNCSFNNPDDATTCGNCPSPLRGLLGEGTILSGRYQVVSVLGCGAMGAVYLSSDTRLTGRRCAIKENRVDPNVSVKVLAQSREQFLAEASVLARLDHPNLPKVSDYFIENDREYLVMDYVEGEDLASALERAQRPVEEASVLAWADQVLDALAYLHSQYPQPIIHRDIKPANLRVDLRGKVKLVDFGLVKLFDPENPTTKVELRGLGTPAYAPLDGRGFVPGGQGRKGEKQAQGTGNSQTALSLKSITGNQGPISHVKKSDVSGRVSWGGYNF